MAGEQKDIFRALSEGRQRQGDNVQTGRTVPHETFQLVPRSPVRDLSQRSIGRRPGVRVLPRGARMYGRSEIEAGAPGRPRWAPAPPHREAASHLPPPGPFRSLGDRTCERAPPMTEQCAGHEISGESGAVDGHKGRVAPRTMCTNPPCHDVLASAVFAAQEKDGVRGSRACRRLQASKEPRTLRFEDAGSPLSSTPSGARPTAAASAALRPNDWPQA